MIMMRKADNLYVFRQHFRVQRVQQFVEPYLWRRLLCRLSTLVIGFEPFENRRHGDGNEWTMACRRENNTKMNSISELDFVKSISNALFERPKSNNINPSSDQLPGTWELR